MAGRTTIPIQTHVPPSEAISFTRSLPIPRLPVILISSWTLLRPTVYLKTPHLFPTYPPVPPSLNCIRKLVFFQPIRPPVSMVSLVVLWTFGTARVRSLMFSPYATSPPIVASRWIQTPTILFPFTVLRAPYLNLVFSQTVCTEFPLVL